MTWRRTPDDLARSLQAAAADAPPSPRMAEIRAAVLDEVVAGHPSSVSWSLLAAAATILLAVALAVGAPAVGSMIDRLVPDRGPGPPPPSVSAEPEPVESGVPSVSMAATPSLGSPTPSAVEARPSASPQARPSPSPSAAGSEPARPIGPPIVLPDPPIVLPTPPSLPLP